VRLGSYNFFQMFLSCYFFHFGCLFVFTFLRIDCTTGRATWVVQTVQTVQAVRATPERCYPARTGRHVDLVPDQVQVRAL
jgi:hypothetical protein